MEEYEFPGGLVNTLDGMFHLGRPLTLRHEAVYIEGYSSIMSSVTQC